MSNLSPTPLSPKRIFSFQRESLFSWDIDILYRMSNLTPRPLFPKSYLFDSESAFSRDIAIFQKHCFLRKHIFVDPRVAASVFFLWHSGGCRRLPQTILWDEILVALWLPRLYIKIYVYIYICTHINTIRNHMISCIFMYFHVFPYLHLFPCISICSLFFSLCFSIYWCIFLYIYIYIYMYIYTC